MVFVMAVPICELVVFVLVMPVLVKSMPMWLAYIKAWSLTTCIAFVMYKLLQ